MELRSGESLKSYAAYYSKVYKEVEGCSKDLAMKTFKLGLSFESYLRQPLTKRLADIMKDFMDQIDQYIWVEEDIGRPWGAPSSVS